MRTSAECQVLIVQSLQIQLIRILKLFWIAVRRAEHAEDRPFPVSYTHLVSIEAAGS